MRMIAITCGHLPKRKQVTLQPWRFVLFVRREPGMSSLIFFSALSLVLKHSHTFVSASVIADKESTLLIDTFVGTSLICIGSTPSQPVDFHST